MKHVFQELSEEKILKLNSRQLQEKIEEIGKIYNVLKKMSEIIVEKKISEIIGDYDIEYIDIITNYIYKNSHLNNRYMICIIKKNVPYSEDVLKISFYDLEQKIYKELAPLRYLIKKDMKFNIYESEIKQINQKPTKDISIKVIENYSTKHIFRELLEEEIFRLTSEQLKTKIEEIEKIYNSLDRMVEPIVKKKLDEIVSCYDVKTVEIKLYYLPIKEDYDSYYRIRISGEDMYTSVPKYSNNTKTKIFNTMRYEIYKELSPLKHLIQNDMSFDISKLRTKNMYYKFEEGIQTKNSQKSLRYKL